MWPRQDRPTNEPVSFDISIVLGDHSIDFRPRFPSEYTSEGLMIASAQPNNLTVFIRLTFASPATAGGEAAKARGLRQQVA